MIKVNQTQRIEVSNSALLQIKHNTSSTLLGKNDGNTLMVALAIHHVSLGLELVIVIFVTLVVVGAMENLRSAGLRTMR